MARTALIAPAHRVAARQNVGGSLSTPDLAPNIDFGGSGLQDMRLGWNQANSATGAAVMGWPLNGPMINAVPSTLTVTAIAAAQVPVAGTALTLVSTTGAGITVMATALQCYPSLVTVPVGTLAIDDVPGYVIFGASSRTGFYDPTKMLARNIQIASAGDDHLATMTIRGADWYGYPMTETITLANAGTAVGLKAIKFVYSATPAGTLSGSNVSIGQGDKFGLPIASSLASLLTGSWNALTILGAGTFAAAVTTTPSATTGDVRGTYIPGSASNNAKRLTITVAPDLAFMLAQGFPYGVSGKTQA